MIDFVSDYEAVTGESIKDATARLEADAEARTETKTKVIKAPKSPKVAPATVAETA